MGGRQPAAAEPVEEEEAGPLPRLRQRGLPRGGGRGRRRGGVRPPPPRRAALQAAAEDEVRQARLGGRAEQGTGQTGFFYLFNRDLWYCFWSSYSILQIWSCCISCCRGILMLPRAATVAVAVAAATIISNVDVTVDAVAAAKHINYYTIHYSSYNFLMVLEPDILAAVARQFRPISPSRRLL